MILNEYVEMREDKLPMTRSFLSECTRAMFDRLRFETAIDVERFERQLNVINYEYAETCYREQMGPVNEESGMKLGARLSQFFKRIGAAIKEILKKIGDFFSRLKEIGKQKQKEGAKKAAENEVKLKQAEKKQEEKPKPKEKTIPLEQMTFKGSSAYGFLKSVIGQSNHQMGTKNTASALDTIVTSIEKMLCLSELEANTKGAINLVNSIKTMGEDEAAAKEISKIHGEIIKLRDEYKNEVAKEASPKAVADHIRAFKEGLRIFLIPSNSNLGSNMIKIPDFGIQEPKADTKWGRSYLSAANRSLSNFYTAFKQGFNEYLDEGFNNKTENIKVVDAMALATVAKGYNSTAYTDTIKGVFAEHIANLESKFKPIEAEGRSLVNLILEGDLGEKMDRINEKFKVQYTADSKYSTSATDEIYSMMQNFAQTCSTLLALLSNTTYNNLEIIGIYNNIAARAKAALADELKEIKDKVETEINGSKKD